MEWSRDDYSYKRHKSRGVRASEHTTGTAASSWGGGNDGTVCNSIKWETRKRSHYYYWVQQTVLLCFSQGLLKSWQPHEYTPLELALFGQKSCQNRQIPLLKRKTIRDPIRLRASVGESFLFTYLSINLYIYSTIDCILSCLSLIKG